MDEIQQLEESLFELNKVKFSKPTVRQLRQGRHALVNRIQRRENRTYKNNVYFKKAELNKRINDLRAKQLLSPLPIQSTSTLNIKLPVKTLTRVESKKRLG